MKEKPDCKSTEHGFEIVANIIILNISNELGQHGLIEEGNLDNNDASFILSIYGENSTYIDPENLPNIDSVKMAIQILFENDFEFYKYIDEESLPKSVQDGIKIWADMNSQTNTQINRNPL